MSSPRTLYRARQFWGALRPRVRASETEEAARFLGPDLFALFSAMTARDQRHAVDVHSRLRDGGCDDPDILAAALLHDVGKGSRIKLWHRVVYVVLTVVHPSLVSRLRGGIATLRDHSELGAQLLAQAAASPEVVRLVREHERPHRAPGDGRLAILRAADDAC